MLWAKPQAEVSGLSPKHAMLLLWQHMLIDSGRTAKGCLAAATAEGVRKWGHTSDATQTKCLRRAPARKHTTLSMRCQHMPGLCLPFALRVCSAELGQEFGHANCLACLLPFRCCTVNTQRRSWQEAADMLNKHATAAVQLQEQFRVLTTSSSSPSSSNSVPQSPRNVAVVGPHVTRPHSAVRVRCSTPSQPQSDQHLPVLDSPRGRQRNSTWRSPAASQCSSLGSTAHKSPCRSNCSSPHLTKSPPVSKSACSMAAAADEASGFQGAHGRACQEGTRLLHFQGVNSSCDCESSGDANDSDSEVNMLQVLLRK